VVHFPVRALSRFACVQSPPPPPTHPTWSGVLVLEEYEHAKARGAKVYAEYVGGYFTCDAHHMTEPQPEGKGVRLCIERALAAAGGWGEVVARGRGACGGDHASGWFCTAMLVDTAMLTQLRRCAAQLAC
jgi:hypothetical protein